MPLKKLYCSNPGSNIGTQVTENMESHTLLIQRQKASLISSKYDSNFLWSFTTVSESEMIHETSP